MRFNVATRVEEDKKIWDLTKIIAYFWRWLEPSTFRIRCTNHCTCWRIPKWLSLASLLTAKSGVRLWSWTDRRLWRR